MLRTFLTTEKLLEIALNRQDQGLIDIYDLKKLCGENYKIEFSKLQKKQKISQCFQKNRCNYEKDPHCAVIFSINITEAHFGLMSVFLAQGDIKTAKEAG